MRTELDGRMDAIMAAMTGDGGPLALATADRRGVTMPMIGAAPPTLAAYFAHFCGQHAEATFLVSDRGTASALPRSMPPRPGSRRHW